MGIIRNTLPTKYALGRIIPNCLSLAFCAVVLVTAGHASSFKRQSKKVRRSTFLAIFLALAVDIAEIGALSNQKIGRSPEVLLLILEFFTMAGCLLPMFLADESSSSSSSNAAGFPPDDEEMMRSSSQTMKNKMSNFKNKLESYLPTETQNSNGPIFKNLENDHSVDERMGRISSPGFFKKKNTIIDPPAEFKNLEIDRDPSAAETRNEEPELPPATSIMMVVLAIVHFVLFVMACLDVKAWADTFGHR